MKDRLPLLQDFFEAGKTVEERKDAVVQRIRDYNDAIRKTEEKMSEYRTKGNEDGATMANLDIDILRMKIDIESLKLQKLDILSKKSS